MDMLNRRPVDETAPECGQLCSACFQTCEVKRVCSLCKLVSYCGTECQSADWGDHKAACTYDTVKAARRENKILRLQHNIIDVSDVCFVLMKLASHLLSLHNSPEKASNQHALNLIYDLRPAGDGKKMLCLLRASIMDIPPDYAYYRSPTSRERRPRALSEMNQMLVESGEAQWVAVVPVFSHPNFEGRYNQMVAAGGTSLYMLESVDILNFSSAAASKLYAIAQLEMMYGYPEASYAQALVRQVNDIIAADTENRHGWRTGRRRRAP